MSEEKQSTELENEKIAISPAQHEDDIASLEREAREKREQVLKQEQEDKSAHPIQPTINKLKKEKRGMPLSFSPLSRWHSFFLHGGVIGSIAILSGNQPKKKNRMNRVRKTVRITVNVTISVKTTRREKRQAHKKQKAHRKNKIALNTPPLIQHWFK